MSNVLLTIFIFSAFFCAIQGKNADEWKSRVIYQILTDRFGPTGEEPDEPCTELWYNFCGGTFAGIEERLDYIADLGANSIWISPIVLNTEGGYHGYWAKNIYEVEPHFGTEQELRDLIAACHDRDIWVMLDLVPNHMGYPPGCDDKVNFDCTMEQLLNFTGLYPFNLDEHYHEYCLIDWDDEGPSQTEMEQCRLANLPDLNQTIPFVNETLLQWVADITADYGFDGYRIDTVRHIAHEFWAPYQAAAGEFCMGEVADGNSETTGSYQGADGLDSLLNYPMFEAFISVFHDGNSMQELASSLAEQREHFEDVTVLGLFADNHDAPRFLNRSNNDIPKFKSALAYVLFGEGIPIIYYGSEQAFNGGQDPENRESLWPYYNTSHDMYQFISSLANIRRQYINDMISASQTEVFVDDDLFVFTRADTKILAAITNVGSGNEAGETFSFEANYEEYVNVLNEDDTITVVDGQVTITLQNGEPKVYAAVEPSGDGGAPKSGPSLLAVICVFCLIFLQK